MRGFSLVELMVAILLGALITTGIVQMFSSNQENYQVLTGQSRMQENGRFAIEFHGLSRVRGTSGEAGENVGKERGNRALPTILPTRSRAR